MLMPISADAEKVAIDIQKYHIGSELKLIGAASTILIEQATVEFAQGGPTAAQIADDANWQQKTTGDIAWQLDAGNLSLVIGGALGWTRFNKASGTCGIEHKY